MYDVKEITSTSVLQCQFHLFRVYLYCFRMNCICLGKWHIIADGIVDIHLLVYVVIVVVFIASKRVIQKL